MWPAPIWTVEVHGDGAALADPAVVGELHPDLVGCRPQRLLGGHLGALEAEEVVAVAQPASLAFHPFQAMTFRTRCGFFRGG
jgi:hypothetical protein